MRVLVLGAGTAGLSAALDLAAALPAGSVLLATKTVLGDGCTRWAQGGIATATGPADVPAHVADTAAAGAGLTDAGVARAVCAAGPDVAAFLTGHGVRFDRDAAGAPARCLEAAHSAARILHAGGDRTGAVVAAALADAVRRSGTEVLEDAFLVDLLVGPTTAGPRVRGAELLLGDGTRRTVAADAVVLATGGAGQVFARTTNPAPATGDGVAAAWRAGAALADLEFVQFHPTVTPPGPDGAPGFLVSEAVRGEGAVLLDAAGHRFMPALDPRAELAPRDVVARAVAAAVAAHDGRPALLDARRVAGGRFADRFPQVAALAAAAGLDPAREPLPVTPAAHYLMGGVRTDAAGRTSLPGLWAVGEVACTGLHGANRLASNSLLEAAALGRAAAADVLAGTVRGVDPRALGDVLVDVPSPATAGTPASHVARRDLQATATEHVGVLRDAAGLELAAKLLTPEEDPLDVSGERDRRVLEDANLLLLARLTVDAATARTTSTGAHHRTDAPHPPTRPAPRRSLRRTPCPTP